MKITPFKFIHCADLHLDSPFECIQSIDPEIASKLRDATFGAFENVVDLAIKEDVDFLIVAGDVYDGADRSLRAQWRFYDALRRAADSGIQCFVTHGNHDPLDGWEAKLEVPGGVYRFGGEEVRHRIAKKGGEELAYIYGISYPSREINENLASRFSREDGAPFAVGVLHCNVGVAPGHDNYAPCMVDDLVACGMDYWALGHIHARKVLRESAPCIVYSGNTQGRSVRELGARGCYLVNVNEAGHIETKFMPTDVIRWFVEDVDIADLETLDTLINTLIYRCTEARDRAGGRDVMLRIRLTGRGPVHEKLRHQESEIMGMLKDGFAKQTPSVWIESIQNHTRLAVDILQRRQVEDFVGEFLRVSEELRTDTDAASTIRQLLTDSSDASIIVDQLEMLTDEDLLSILDDAETMGLDWLLEGGA